jgi:DNA modification methylase
LDESSILKSIDGKTMALLLSEILSIPYRTAFTATPAPNDFMEIGAHAEFVGVCRQVEMLSRFFVHDGGETQKWRLKGHAQEEFWKWVSSWAVMFRKPSDLGFDDKGFDLPKLQMLPSFVETEWKPDHYDGLFAYQASTLSERIEARRNSVEERAKHCAQMVNDSSESWVIWCNLNPEGNLLEKLIPDAVQVSGRDSMEDKIVKLRKFSSGQKRVIITKPKIAGFGLNWQHCRNVAFVGLSDSWEQLYQCVRRCWRFGQKKSVRVHVIISRAEGAVLKNIMRKEEDAERMMESMTKHIVRHFKENPQLTDAYMRNVKSGENWTLYQDDCVEALRKMKEESIAFSVFSPPFSSLYTYSASARDMGNCSNDAQFEKHCQFLAEQLHRVLMAGRLVSFHCMNLPTSKARDGVIGIRDFRGLLIRIFQKAGFIFHSEVCIWKDPVTAMQRTKAIGLLWKQLKKDSCMSRQGIPDYLVTMRKLGENKKFVARDEKQFPVALWQKWASPVWMDINPSDTLQYRSAREHKDERHICPLQLDVIRRSILMWSNKGERVLSPFAGIGSEGYVALQCGRKFVGVELKESYFRQAAANLKRAEYSKRRTLFPVNFK